MPSYQYRDSHVKDKTVSPTVLSLTWQSPYLGQTVFILRRGPGHSVYWASFWKTSKAVQYHTTPCGQLQYLCGPIETGMPFIGHTKAQWWLSVVNSFFFGFDSSWYLIFAFLINDYISTAIMIWLHPYHAIQSVKNELLLWLKWFIPECRTQFNGTILLGNV